jgi:hypothetical protein
MTGFTRFTAAMFTAALFTAPALSDEPADQAAVQSVRQTGGQVLEIAQNDPRLDVAYHLSNVELTPDILKTLEGIKARLAHLNLRGTNLNDDLSQYLKPLTELTRLHLEKTKITDAALPNLAGMQKLEYLNLYGTNITDAGLEPLGSLAALKKLYVWETKVTLAGVHKLHVRLPELQIIGGPQEPKPPQAIVAVEAPKPAKK